MFAGLADLDWSYHYQLVFVEWFVIPLDQTRVWLSGTTNHLNILFLER